MLDLDAEAIYGALARRVREHIAGMSPVLVGVHTGGVWLAERLRADLGIGPTCCSSTMSSTPDARCAPP